MALKYGGKTISDYSAMRGPCPEGFHVPLKAEWQKLKTMMDSLSFTTGGDWRIKLHMPFSGKRAFNNAAVNFQGTYGCYWTCMRESGNNMQACHLNISSSQVSANYITSRADGLSIRPFKDIPVIPTSSRTTIYEGGTWGDGTNWYTPGIFWDQANGLISISSNGKTTDSSVWITITDKNLGATTVYSDGNTLSQSNCGNYFQRGNGYGFAWSGSITTSQTQVDASGYGPGNYYSGNTFIIGNQDWSSVQNDNLRGGVTGVKHNPVYIVDRYYGGKMIGDYSAMRGPCSEGFHIPLDSERNSVRIMLHNFGMSYTDIVADLHLPISGYRAQEYGSYYNGQVYYWTSKVFNNSYLGQAYRISTYTADDVITTQGEATGGSIRPFHDGYVAPTSSWTTIRSSGNGGIFWNQTDGLISITSNGVSGCTIADKNLGATTVYNNGNTLSEANCGKFYQRGNNYGFPFSGNVTTSSTKVTNANNYGPGNYYSSSTFVTSTDSNTTWMNPVNPNLWGGVTGVQNRVAKVKEVYYNTTKIWPLSGTVSGSVDFRNVTKADLTSQGWLTSGEPWVALDSTNGLYCSATSNDKYAGLYMPMDFTNAKKATLTWEFRQDRRSWAWGPRFGITQTNNVDKNSFVAFVNFCSENSYQQQELSYINNSGSATHLANQQISLTGGNYTIKLEINFETGEVVKTVTGATPYTQTGTLTSELINTIKQFGYIAQRVGWGTPTASYCYTMAYEIEY